MAEVATRRATAPLYFESEWIEQKPRPERAATPNQVSGGVQ
jgi:hypothetical protein